MQPCRQLRGLVPVVVTPLNRDESIDAPALAAIISMLVEQGVGGLWVLGTGGEDMNLSFRRRLEVARAACEANAGRVPLMLGASFFAMQDIKDFFAETKGLDFDGYHVMPYHPLLGLDRLDWFYRTLADACPRPLWMYTSANWSRPITPEFVAGLRDHPNLAGIKFSTRNIVDMSKVAMLAGEGFQVTSAVAGSFLACLSVGVKAATTIFGCCLAGPIKDIHERFLAGDLDGALDGQRRILGFLSALPKGVRQDNFLEAAEVKYLLSLRGLCQEHMTSYYRALTEAEKAEIRAAADRFGLS